MMMRNESMEKYSGPESDAMRKSITLRGFRGMKKFEEPCLKELGEMIGSLKARYSIELNVATNPKESKESCDSGSQPQKKKDLKNSTFQLGDRLELLFGVKSCSKSFVARILQSRISIAGILVGISVGPAPDRKTPKKKEEADPKGFEEKTRHLRETCERALQQMASPCGEKIDSETFIQRVEGIKEEYNDKFEEIWKQDESGRKESLKALQTEAKKRQIKLKPKVFAQLEEILAHRLWTKCTLPLLTYLDEKLPKEVDLVSMIARGGHGREKSCSDETEREQFDTHHDDDGDHDLREEIETDHEDGEEEQEEAVEVDYNELVSMLDSEKSKITAMNLSRSISQNSTNCMANPCRDSASSYGTSETATFSSFADSCWHSDTATLVTPGDQVYGYSESHQDNTGNFEESSMPCPHGFLESSTPSWQASTAFQSSSYPFSHGGEEVRPFDYAESPEDHAQNEIDFFANAYEDEMSGDRVIDMKESFCEKEKIDLEVDDFLQNQSDFMDLDGLA